MVYLSNYFSSVRPTCYMPLLRSDLTIGDSGFGGAAFVWRLGSLRYSPSQQAATPTAAPQPLPHTRKRRVFPMEFTCSYATRKPLLRVTPPTLR